MKKANRPHPRTLALETLGVILSILLLILIAVWRYPASLSVGGSTSLLITASALLVYGAVAVWARRPSADKTRLTFSYGAPVGVLLGALAMLNHTLETFATLDSSWSAILGVGMWGAMFLAFSVSGSAIYQRVRSFPHAVGAAVWGAIVSTVLILFYGYLTAFLFMPYVQQQLQAAFAHSGFVDPQAFVIKNTFDSGAEHALIAPLVGAIFGLAGGWAAWLLGSLRRKIALFLAIGELILASLALLSIQFASSLARSERPPYILFGLLALGMTLACAHPIFSALQKRPQIANGEW